MKVLSLLILNQIFTMTPGYTKFQLNIFQDFKMSKEELKSQFPSKQLFRFTNASITPLNLC